MNPPTAPQFHSAFAEDDYRAAAERSNRVATPKPLSAYVHIPFCKSLCYYCACNKIITHNADRAAEYLDWLKHEIAVQGALFDNSRRMTQLHLGGVTPTYLTNAQLGELMAALDEVFHFAPAEEREFSLEVDPRTVSPIQIHELRALGFNRDVINELICHGRIDFAAIERDYEIDFQDYFAEALAELREPEADGLIELDGASLTVLPAGRLMMRNLAMAFDAYLNPAQQRFSRTLTLTHGV